MTLSRKRSVSGAIVQQPLPKETQEKMDAYNRSQSIAAQAAQDNQKGGHMARSARGEVDSPYPLSKRQQAEREVAIAKQHEALQNDFASRLTGSFPYFRSALTEAMGLIGAWNAHQGFWDSENVGEKLALMHSELSEALEADRKDLPSDKIPGFTGVEEELADTVIRILDFAGHFQLRLAEALHAKLIYNLGREYRHGKSY